MEAYPGEVFKGKVAFRDPALNPSTRTMNVRYDLDNSDGKLQPGMFATVTLRTPLAETSSVCATGSRRPHADHHPGPDDGRAAEDLPGHQGQARLDGRPDPGGVASRKVWVCCSGCPHKLKAEPAKYLARLESAPAGEVLSVPESAVIDTGDRKVVYVEAEPGVFEGREVVLGARIGDRFPVLEGLSAGEKVAATGAFLIDAESRLNQGAVATSEPASPTSDQVEPLRRVQWRGPPALSRRRSPAMIEIDHRVVDPQPLPRHPGRASCWASRAAAR